MIHTAPVYGDAAQLGTTSVFVRFKETKLSSMYHRVSDTPGARLMLVDYRAPDSTYTITYVNDENMVLKRISYMRESVMEFTAEESVCRIVPNAPKPPLKVV